MDEHQLRVLKAQRLAQGMATALSGPTTRQEGRVQEASSLLQERRFVDGKVNLIEQQDPGYCDRCRLEGRRVTAVVDGMTITAHPEVFSVTERGETTGSAPFTAHQWALMCLDHFASDGVGLGWGIGQVYLQAPFVNWPIEELDAANLSPRPMSIGYAHVLRQLHLAVMPHHRWSFLVPRGASREISGRQSHLHVLRSSAHPSLWLDIQTDEFRWSSVVSHLTYAMKHEGVSLEILDALFARVDLDAFEQALVAHIQETPTGAHVRRLWFVYEYLTDRLLNMENVTVGNYVPLIDPTDEIVGPERRSPRHRVLVNLLGTRSFCPRVRRVGEDSVRGATQLRAKVSAAIADLPPETLRRAAHYLYTKETRSSFAIERVNPSSTREERFVWLLEQAHGKARLDKEALIELQNAIVDDRFADNEWRTEQVYVGDVLDRRAHRIHFIAPRPSELPSIMAGFLEMLALNIDRDLAPLAWSAAVSFGFDFIHPFQDGNGRIHRWLIHWVLARMHVAPEGAIIPISAVMLLHRQDYDAVLEAFSRPLLRLLDYRVDADGVVSVQEDLSRAYRYFDATRMAAALSAWFDEAVDEELATELRWLEGLDQAKLEVRRIVDMPDRLLTTFVRCCLDNRGRLSKRKRQDIFHMLNDEEIVRMEEAVALAFESYQVGTMRSER